MATLTKKNNKKDQNATAKAAQDGVDRTSRFSDGRDESKSKQKTLDDLFEEGLKDIYSAETQLLEALPKMAKAADSEELQDAFEEHLQQTKRQVERLDKIFSRLKIDASDTVACEAMKGLIAEADKIMEEYEESAVRDSALIIGAQKIEHYEIAAYGSLCELADVLGHGQIVNILERTLQEEGDADHKLSAIAQDVNDEAFETSHYDYEEAEAEFGEE